MSALLVYREGAPERAVLETRERAKIAGALKQIGVRFEQWQARELAPGAAEADVLAAYDGFVKRLMAEEGYAAVDVVRMHPEHPERAALRAKFLREHVHSEDEVRFFVEGQGAFFLHKDGKVFRVVCERGDLISVPAGIAHWFDAGEHPRFCAIRLFTSKDGWVARYTGDPIAARFAPFAA